MRQRWVPDWADDVPAELLEVLRAEYLPEMPPVELGAYLLSYFLEVGPIEQTPMGDVRLSHTEIAFYQQNLGIRLAPWEVRVLCRLSMDYLNSKFLAEKASASSPWEREVTPDELAAVAKSLQQTIRDLAKL